MTLKKILSLLVAVTMLFSCVGITALAEETAVEVAANEIVLGDADFDNHDGMTVFDGTNYYATMEAALKGIHGTDNAVLYCKPDANVGEMTHEHVCKSLTVYGNGAYVGGGHQDFEVEYYKCYTSTMGSSLTDDVTLNVDNLTGAGAWGNRTSEYTVNINFTNCKEMSEVYFSGNTGVNNITLTNCTFTSNEVSECKVYSNANGTVTVKDCSFSNLDEAINLNHKAAGTQTVVVENCSFDTVGDSSVNYAAPVRVLSSVEGGISDVTITNCTFKNTVANSIGQDADILLDYGIGTTTANISETVANVGVEKESNIAEYTKVAAEETYTLSTLDVPTPDGLSGSGTETDPYLIKNLDDLILFRDSVNAGATTYNAPGVYVALGDNIDMKDVDWSVNIGDDCNATFDGIFDGKNKTIYNLNSTETEQKGDVYVCTGLFGVIYGTAVVKNLTIENVSINTKEFTGNNVGAVVGLAYNCTGSVENVNVTGDININAPGIYGVGAIVGYALNKKLTIKNCEVDGNNGSSIEAKSGVGGIVGYAGGNILVTECTVQNISAVGGVGLVGGINGILCGGTATGNTVKNIDLTVTGEYWQNSAAIVVGTISDPSIVSDTTYEDVTINGVETDVLVGSDYAEKPTAPVGKVQAKIDDKYYATLEKAVEKANSGETITLLANVEDEVGIPEGVTLNTNGYYNGTPVAVVNGVECETLAEALSAASTMTGDVTIEIYDKVTLNQNLTGSYDSIKFVGMDTDAEIYLDVTGYIEAIGKNVIFEDLTLSKSNTGGFIDNAGFMNVAFGVYHATSVSYTECTFSNGAYASSGKNTFTKCTFYRSYDRYGFWAYGSNDIVVDGCTFADFRGIKMFDENKGANNTTVLTVKNTNFSAVTDKPAIVLTYGESVTLEGNTYSSTGVFELDNDPQNAPGTPNGTTITSDKPEEITCVDYNGKVCGVLVDGKIYTSVAAAAEAAVKGSAVTLLHDSTETVEFVEGVELNKNGYAAENVTVSTPSYVATIKETGETYSSLQAAIDAIGTTAGDYTILLASGTITEGTTKDKFQQAAGVNITIEGQEGTVFTGTIEFHGKGQEDGKLTIRNIDFVTNEASRIFINAVDTNYYPSDILIESCSFTGPGSDSASAAAINLKSARNVTIRNCTGTGLHSILQNTAGWNIELDTVKVTDSGRGASLGTAQGVTIKNCEFDVSDKKYGIRLDAAYTQDVVFENCKITAFIPVVVRNASKDYSLTFNGTNTMTAANTDGLWCAIGNDEYDTNGEMPSAATGKVTVTLNDTSLDENGVYGAYKAAVAKIGDTEYTSVAKALADAKAKNMTDVTILLTGETTASTADTFDLSYGTAFDNVTFKQEDNSKPYYLYRLRTGDRTIDGGKFTFDGVNIIFTNNIWFECDVVLKNNSVVTRSQDSKNFVYYGTLTIEPGSKFISQIDDVMAGSLIVDGGKTDGSYSADYSYKSGFVDVREGHTLELKNGAYAFLNLSNEIGNLALMGNVNISDSKMDVCNTIAMSENSCLSLDTESIVTTKTITGTGTISVDAADFSGEDVQIIKADMSGFTGNISVKNNDYAEYKITDNGLVITLPVAKIGNDTYDTLANAIAAATENDTVTLLSDTDVNAVIEIRNAITLDLNGHTITNNVVKERAFHAYADFTIDGTDEGSAIISGDVDTYGVLRIYADREITLNGGSYTGNTDNGGIFKIMLEGTGADVTFNNVNVVTNCWIMDGAGEFGSLTVKGGKFATNGVGIVANINSNGTAVFENATITSGTGPALELSGYSTSDATLTNCALNAGPETTNAYGTGGAALFVSGDINVTVDGGSYIGTTYSVGITTSGKSLTVKGGEFDGAVASHNNDGTVAIEGGKFTNFSVETNGSTGKVKISGGTYDQDPTAYVVDGYVALKNMKDQYVVGVKPTATVTNEGAVVVPGNGYTVYNNFGNTTSSSNSEDMPLPFVMQYVANESAEAGAASPYAEWYGDFVVSVTGLSSNSFEGTGCYLAGHYGSFGWVKVPIDSLTIENGVRYPIMLSTIGNGQKYEYICGGVDTFKCALYLTPEVLAANPNLKVDLELCVVDNSEGGAAAQQALATPDSPYTYQSAVKTFDEAEFEMKVASITDAEGKVTNYATLKEAIADVKEGETIQLLTDIELDDTLQLSTAGDIIIDGNGKTITLADDFANTNSNAAAIVLGTTGVGDDTAKAYAYTLKNVVFDGITGSSIIRAEGVTLTMDGCTVTNNNMTAGNGGLLRLESTNAVITNTTFENNTTTNGYGVITYNYNATGSDAELIIDNCTFVGNDVVATGVVYYNDGGSCTVKNSEFTRNNVSTNGNAATLYAGFNDKVTVTGTLFEKNTVTTTHDTSKRVAGGIFVGAYGANVENYTYDISGNAFENNSATVDSDGTPVTAPSGVAFSDYEDGIDLSGNYWGTTEEPKIGVNYAIEKSNYEATMNSYYTSYSVNENGNIVLDGEVEIKHPVAKIGDTTYPTLAEALKAATNDDIVTLIWAEGDAPIAMNGAVFGKSVTITGDATVDWDKGFLFVGRGGEGDGTVIFDEANLKSASNSSSTGIHVSGREKNTTDKYDGTVIIKNSTIELDYLINKGTMTLDNSTLTVKNGFSVGGRPASETESGEDATATITLNNNSKVIVNNHNGMGLGYEALGVMNIESGSTFEYTQNFLITAKGKMNVNGGNVIGNNVTLTNNGTINVSGTSDIAANVTGEGWVYMNGVTMSDDTKLIGAKVRFASGTNNIDGSVIDDGFFQVGIGAYNGKDANVDTTNGVIVNVKNAKIGSNGETYAGWVGTGFYDTDAEKAAVMTEAKYVLNIENSIAEFGYLHISNDGEINVKGNATEKKWYNNSDYSFYSGEVIINGVATFDATDVLALYTKVSCDNGTEKPGTLNIVNGTEYEAERHNAAIDGTNFELRKTGVANVDETSELYIGEYTEIATNAVMNIGGTATALGTITNNGTINLTTGDATLTTPEAPVVNSTVVDYNVVYADGKYSMVKAEAAELFKFRTRNVTLGNSLALNYFVAKSDLDGEDYYAEVKHVTATGEKTKRIDFNEWQESEDGDRMFISYSGIAAKQMTDEITITVHHIDGTPASETRTESLRNYGIKFLERYAGETGYEDWTTAIIDMLNYGAAAQTHFNYKTDDLANAATEEYQEYASKEYSVAKDVVATEKARSSSLILEDSIKYIGAFNEVTDNMYAMVSFTNHYGTTSYNYRIDFKDFNRREKDGVVYYEVAVDKLVIADAAQPVTITVYNGDEVHAQIIESINGYLSRAITAYPSDELFPALAKFAASARKTLNNK